MATLSEIRTRVAFQLGNKADFDDITDHNINEAILQIIFEARPYEMQTSTTFTTTDAQSSYSIAAAGDVAVSDLYAIELVRNNTDQRLITQGTVAEYDNLLQTGSSATGEPRRWTRHGANIILYKQVPDSTSRTIQIRYLKRPTRLSADADVLALNDEWLSPLEDLASAKGFVFLNQPDKAAMKLEAYRTAIGFRETPDMIESESPEGRVFFPANPMSDVRM